MTYAPDVKDYLVNSIVFDVNAANVSLNQVNISGISSAYSSPVIYIENDPSATEIIWLKLNQSIFANN